MYDNIQSRLGFAMENPHISDLVGGESIASLSHGITRITDSLAKHWEDLFDTSLPAIETRPLPIENVVPLIEKINSKDLGNVTVYSPAELEVYQEKFNGELLVQLQQLADIDERLYQPVIRWLARCVTDKEFGDLVWADRKISFTNVESNRKDFAKLFDRQPTMIGDGTARPFKDCYRSVKDFKNATDTLRQMTNLCIDIDLSKLKKSEERLNELVKKFVKGYDDGITFASEVNMERLILLVSTAAVETEYLSGLLFYANLTVTAHNQTVEKLKENFS